MAEYQLVTRYFDYRSMMAEKARLEGGHVKSILAYQDDIRAWAAREYPQKSEIYLAHLADHATWDRFFDSRDNPIKAPYKFIRSDVPEMRGQRQHYVTEPYTSVERQLAVAFAESFPKTPLATFFCYLDLVQSEFAGRMDMSDAEKGWSAEITAYSHFWGTSGGQDTFAFPGLQPKVITDDMIRQTPPTAAQLNSSIFPREQDQKYHFPIQSRLPFESGALQKKFRRDEHSHGRHNKKGTSSDSKGKINLDRHNNFKIHLQNTVPGSPDCSDGQIATNKETEDMTTFAASAGNSERTNQGSRNREIRDPYHEARPSGAVHISQMPGLLAGDTVLVTKSGPLSSTSIQRFYDFRLSKYLKDRMHSDKTIGELEAFAQADTLRLMDSYEEPRIHDNGQRRRKRGAQSSRDTSEDDTNVEEVSDLAASLHDPLTLSTPRTRSKRKHMGEKRGRDEEGIPDPQYPDPLIHGSSFQQLNASNTAPLFLGVAQGRPREALINLKDSGVSGALTFDPKRSGSMQNPSAGEQGNAFEQIIRKDNGPRSLIHVPAFTFKDPTKAKRVKQLGINTPRRRSDPYHDIRPVGSPHVDPLPGLRALQKSLAARSPNFKRGSIGYLYSKTLARLLRTVRLSDRPIEYVENLAETKTLKVCQMACEKFLQQNPPITGTKAQRIFFHVLKEPKPLEKRITQG